MFRVFSFIITGSEDQHMQVRHAIIRHMRVIGSALWESQFLYCCRICDVLVKFREITASLVLNSRQVELIDTLLPLEWTVTKRGALR